MQAEKRLKSKVKVRLGEAGQWQEPPVLSRERFHAGGVAELHLIEDDKMDQYHFL